MHAPGSALDNDNKNEYYQLSCDSKFWSSVGPQTEGGGAQGL